MKYLCPICGYHMEDPPADYNICACCGTEFGYHTLGRRNDELRQEWLRNGAEWWSPVDPAPAGWNPYRQLIQAGIGVVLTPSSDANRAVVARISQKAVRVFDPIAA
jgi:hypothetical protein